MKKKKIESCLITIIEFQLCNCPQTTEIVSKIIMKTVMLKIPVLTREIFYPTSLTQILKGSILK